MHLLLGTALGLSPVAAATLVWRRSSSTRDIPTLRAVGVGIAAAALAVTCHFAEIALWDWTGLSLVALPGKEAEALLAMFLFAAPLEEGAKVLAIWPLYSNRRIFEVRHGVWLAIAAGVGFAAGRTAAVISLGDPSGVAVVRALLAVLVYVASPVLWGAALGARVRTSWFALAWTLTTGLSGLYLHIVLGRGPGVLVLALPILLTLLAVAYAVVRRASAREAALRPIPGRSASDRARARRSEPPSLRQVWSVLEPRHAPLMLHWIALGTLVTAGVGLVAFGAALYTGHWLGLDFASADEADVRSNGPLVFLASAVGLAFPVAGYLVARASGTQSVLEPALGAALAVFVAVAYLSVTTPLAAIFALALTPIAFLLASGGAWFGISR
jgi:hypothetical protein